MDQEYPGNYTYHDVLHHVTIDSLIPILTIFGIVGNIFSLIVMCLQTLCTPSKDHLIIHCLRALAVSDLLYCTFMLIATRLPYDNVYTSANLTYIFARYGNVIITTFFISSTWITVVMVTTRFLAICFPLKIFVRDYLNVRMTIVCLVSIFVLSALTTLPLLLASESVREPDTGYLRIKWDISSTLVKINMYLNMFLHNIIPSLLLGILNALLIRQVKRSANLQAHVRRVQRSNSDNSQTQLRNSKLTATLIATSTVFLVLVAPLEFTRLILIHLPDTPWSHQMLSNYNYVNMIMQTLNSSMNFVLYYIINSTFRRHFNQLVLVMVLQIRRRTKHGSSYKTTTQTNT